MAARVWDSLAEARAKHTDVRWLAPEKLHLTLVFLGPTDPARVETISVAIEGVTHAHKPFEVVTGHAGGRTGGRGGGVAWLRLVDGGQEIAQLSLDIDRAIDAHTYDAHRAPRPHLTIARGVAEPALQDLRRVADVIRLTWTVDRVVLLRSHTHPRGSRYEELATAALMASP